MSYGDTFSSVSRGGIQDALKRVVARGNDDGPWWPLDRLTPLHDDLHWHRAE